MGGSKGVAIIVIRRGTSRTFKVNGGEFDLSIFNSVTHKRVYVENFKNVVNITITVTDFQVTFGASFGHPEFYDEDIEWDDVAAEDNTDAVQESGGCGGSFRIENSPELFLGVELLHQNTTLVEIR